MSNFIRPGNEQFNPKLYNNQINSAGSKTACQTLGKQAGGSKPVARETYGVSGVENSDAQLFAGSYAPVKLTKLNQCGAGAKKKKVVKKRKTTKKKKATKKKKTAKKKKTSSKKKKTTKKKKTVKKKKTTSRKKKTATKRKSLSTKFRNVFGMKGGNVKGHHAGYSPEFKGIAPYNSALANPQSIKSVDSCTAPNSYNHFTGVSK